MKNLMSALFAVSLGTYALSSACSPSTMRDSSGSGGSSDEGGSTGSTNAKGGSGGSKSGTGGSKTGGITGSGGSSTGGSSSGGSSTGGSSSGGSAGASAAGGSGMGGTKSVGGIYGMADSGPYVAPFPVVIPPGTYTANQGVVMFSGGNTCCIGSVDEGDWTRYPAVNFGGHCGLDKFTVKYATPNDGGIVEVRLDSLDGPVIASVPLVKTGVDFSTGGEASSAIIPVAGSHELVVRFLGVSFGIGNFTGFAMTPSGARMKCP